MRLNNCNIFELLQGAKLGFGVAQGFQLTGVHVTLQLFNNFNVLAKRDTVNYCKP